MKKLNLFIAALLVSLGACSPKEQKPADNVSLAKSSQTVIYEVSLEIDSDKPNWMGNIDRKKFLTQLFNQVKDGSLPAFRLMDNPSTANPISWDGVLSAMDAANDTIHQLDVETGEENVKIIKGELHLSEIRGIIFIEEWSINAYGVIEKEVLGVAPLRFFSSGDDSVRQKRVPFVAYYGDNRPELFENF